MDLKNKNTVYNTIVQYTGMYYSFTRKYIDIILENLIKINEDSNFSISEAIFPINSLNPIHHKT